MKNTEIVYQMTMNAVKKLYEQGFVSLEEYYAFDTKMRDKYAPTFGTLFSEIDLLKVENRGNM